MPEGRARIVVAAGSFHGRTTTIVGFSTDPDARGGFGPFTPGFDVVPYGDARRAARPRSTPTPSPCCVEPIQGEAGVVVPPAGLPGRRPARSATPAGVLFVADEVQSGPRPHRAPARDAAPRASTPTSTCSARRSAAAIVPLSAVVADADVLGVLRPGQHGSTFGGNPLACAVGRAVVGLLADRRPCWPAPATSARTCTRGSRASSGTGSSRCAASGSWAGIDVDPRLGDGRAVSEALRGARRAGQGHARRDDPDLPAAGVDADEELDSRRRRARAATLLALSGAGGAPDGDGFGVPNLAHSDDRSALGHRQFGPTPTQAERLSEQRGTAARRRRVSGRSAPNSTVSNSSAVISARSCGRLTARISTG